MCGGVVGGRGRPAQWPTRPRKKGETEEQMKRHCAEALEQSQKGQRTRPRGAADNRGAGAASARPVRGRCARGRRGRPRPQEVRHGQPQAESRFVQESASKGDAYKAGAASGAL